MVVYSYIFPTYYPHNVTFKRAHLLYDIGSGTTSLCLCDFIRDIIFNHTKGSTKSHIFPYNHLIVHLLLEFGVPLLSKEDAENSQFALSINPYYKSIAQLFSYDDTLGPSQVITPPPLCCASISQTSSS